MKSAVIGRVEGDIPRIEPLRKTRIAEDQELTSQVEVTGVKRTADGLDITEGRAARQELTDVERIRLSNDSISKVTESERTTKYTDFIAAPSDFIGIGSSEGAFLFDLLAEETGVSISRVEVDIDDFASSFPQSTPWKVGFYGHGDQAENGVIHGENVLEDDEFGSVLANTKKNQLGLRMQYENREYKMTITQSGYVSVYEPSNLDTTEFAHFVVDKILPYTD